MELEAPDISQSSSDSTMIPSLPSFNKHLKQGVPLLVLLIFNVVYTHTVYFALFIGLLVVFDWANDVIVRQSTLQVSCDLQFMFYIYRLNVDLLFKLKQFSENQIKEWLVKNVTRSCFFAPGDSE